MLRIAVKHKQRKQRAHTRSIAMVLGQEVLGRTDATMIIPCVLSPGIPFLQTLPLQETRTQQKAKLHMTQSW